MPHQKQKCFSCPRSCQGGFNLAKLKAYSFVCVFLPAGQKILHHRSDVLETVVLINPSDEAVSTEVRVQRCSLSGRASHSGRDPAVERDSREKSSWSRMLGPVGGCSLYQHHPRLPFPGGAKWKNIQGLGCFIEASG